MEATTIEQDGQRIECTGCGYSMQRDDGFTMHIRVEFQIYVHPSGGGDLHDGNCMDKDEYDDLA
jgi:hypothetical protein